MAIPQGTEVTNQYVATLKGTALRQTVLMNKWFFQCGCQRCADPTELGSYLSALVCTQCKGQCPVVSTDPMDFSAGEYMVGH